MCAHYSIYWCKGGYECVRDDVDGMFCVSGLCQQTRGDGKEK